MADRIFPSRASEESLDSELVFKGIDWDNFQVKTAKKEKMPADLLEHFKSLNEIDSEDSKESEESDDKKVKSSTEKDHVLAALLALAEEDDDDDTDEDEDSDDEDEDDDVTSNTKTAKKKSCPKCGEKIKTFKKNCVHCGEPNPYYDDKYDAKDDNVESSWKTALKKLSEESDDDTENDDNDSEDDDDKRIVKGKEPKTAGVIRFTHPSQLSADAVEAALAAGDKALANTILAARHERRLRLASNIERVVEAQKETQLKLAQRRAYRENLVKTASEVKSEEKVSSSNGFVKVSEMNDTAKKAFASKAIAAGFPQEYVAAMLNNEVAENKDLAEIKTVMSSDLNSNVKKAAVSSMVKVATLTNADYDRLVDYWVNELGYGDREWVEALFTKKYDK